MAASYLTIALRVLADDLQEVLVSGQVGIAEIELNLQHKAQEASP
jgi:hypothetical protein